MKKLLICLSFILFCVAAFPQEEGFFNVYEQTEKSFCASAVVETEDGGLIIAVYDYYGGAHGMQFNEHHLFDLNSGNELKLADLCDMNDDTFKNLIAMKTVADWKEDDSQYYESYEYNPDYANELFDSVREYASKDMAVGFTETGIVVEYTPYQYGPYASGYIYVPVSYEELGIDINK